MEPFVPHTQETEYYININSVREGDNILFYHEGGVDVGDVDAKASRLLIAPSEEFPVFCHNQERTSLQSAHKITRRPPRFHRQTLQRIRRFTIYLP